MIKRSQLTTKAQLFVGERPTVAQCLLEDRICRALHPYGRKSSQITHRYDYVVGICDFDPGYYIILLLQLIVATQAGLWWTLCREALAMSRDSLTSELNFVTPVQQRLRETVFETPRQIDPGFAVDRCRRRVYSVQRSLRELLCSPSP